jgi:predicted nucleic acid-binding Zn ribbon protein
MNKAQQRILKLISYNILSIEASVRMLIGIDGKDASGKTTFADNLSTGVIAKPLAESLREREVVGIAAHMDDADRSAALALSQEAQAANQIRYRSLEGREHAKKARAMLGPGPQRTCAGCGKAFQQSTPMGKALYCSRECRDNAYAEQRRVNAKRRVRQQDGTFKWVLPNALSSPAAKQSGAPTC